MTVEDRFSTCHSSHLPPPFVTISPSKKGIFSVTLRRCLHSKASRVFTFLSRVITTRLLRVSFSHPPPHISSSFVVTTTTTTPAITLVIIIIIVIITHTHTRVFLFSFRGVSLHPLSKIFSFHGNSSDGTAFPYGVCVSAKTEKLS